MNCEYCQSPVHIWFQCPKKPDGWKPARLAKKSTAVRKADVHDMRASVGSGGVRQNTRSFSGDLQAVEPAGSSVLPVDTNSPEMASEQPQAHGSSPCMDQGKIGGQQPTVQLVTAGETATKFDKKAWMKAYMKIYMRKRRAKQREGI